MNKLKKQELNTRSKHGEINNKSPPKKKKKKTLNLKLQFSMFYPLETCYIYLPLLCRQNRMKSIT